MEKPMPPEYADWSYRDLPLMRVSYWTDLMNIFGPGNVNLLAVTRRQFDDGLYVRGQVWISPAGMGNLFKHNEAKSAPSPRSPTMDSPREITEAEVIAFAKAHDQEDAAQQGEPSPWLHYDCEGDCEDCKDFALHRIASVKAGFEAVARLRAETQTEENENG